MNIIQGIIWFTLKFFALCTIAIAGALTGKKIRNVRNTK